MLRRMASQRSFVTGANRGLGLEFVRQLLARGDRVVATCRHPGKASALNALAGEHPGRLHVLPLDVADPRAIAEVARELLLLDDDAGDHIDLLVNGAGVLHSGERFGSVPAAVQQACILVANRYFHRLSVPFSMWESPQTGQLAMLIATNNYLSMCRIDIRLFKKPQLKLLS